MEFNLKDYKIFKTKSYLKKKTFFFLLNTINFESNNKVIIEQNLKLISFNYFKIFNKLTSNILNNSIYSNIKITNGIIFFIKPITDSKIQSKKIIIGKFELLLLTLLAIKLNNKIYTITRFKNFNSLGYVENKILFYQFAASYLKKISK